MSRPGFHQSVLGNRGDHRNVVLVFSCEDVLMFDILPVPAMQKSKLNRVRLTSFRKVKSDLVERVLTSFRKVKSDLVELHSGEVTGEMSSLFSCEDVLMFAPLQSMLNLYALS
jgi:hypothetical protein